MTVPLLEVVLSAITAPTDRVELTDVLTAEAYRTVVVGDETPLELRSGSDDLLDACRLPELVEADLSTVGRWAAMSAIPLPWGRTLHRLARAVGGPVLEAGTGSGLSAAYLALGARRHDPDHTVTTIEMSPMLARRARANLATGGIAGVEVVEGDQHRELPDRIARHRPALIHIDSDHGHRSTGDLLRAVADTVTGAILLCLDDIRWSDGMEQLWVEASEGAFATAAVLDLGLWGVLLMTSGADRTPEVHRLDVPHGTSSGPVPTRIDTSTSGASTRSRPCSSS